MHTVDAKKFSESISRGWLLSGLLMTILFISVVPAQNKSLQQIGGVIVPEPYYQYLVDQVCYDSVLANLTVLESFGIKEPGSNALVEARDWIVTKMAGYGYDDIAFHEFSFDSFNLHNIIATKVGTVHPQSSLIIDGHYDSINGPGANDNGSGVAVLLETARILAGENCLYSIKFIFFSAEEQGLIGSNAYVEEIVLPDSVDIMLVLNVDQVGGVAGMKNNTITCERDSSNAGLPGSNPDNDAASSAYTDTLAQLVDLYTDLKPTISYAYGSDYMPFEAEGFTITGFFETNRSNFTHTAQDLIINMDPFYVYQVTRATLAAALSFSGSQIQNTPPQITFISPLDLESVPLDSEQTFRIKGIDNESDSLIYTIKHGQDEVMDSTATFYFTQTGPDSIIATVIDEQGLESRHNWFFFVTDVSNTSDKRSDPITTYFLFDPYPNPFNRSVVISYFVPVAGQVSLTVYNEIGQEVTNLYDGLQVKGKHSVYYHPNNTASGTYFIVFRSVEFNMVRSAVLIK